MFTRFLETFSRATRSEPDVNEVNEGGGEVESPYASHVDLVVDIEPTLSQEGHVE